MMTIVFCTTFQEVNTFKRVYNPLKGITMKGLSVHLAVCQSNCVQYLHCWIHFKDFLLSVSELHAWLRNQRQFCHIDRKVYLNTTVLRHIYPSSSLNPHGMELGRFVSTV